MPRVFRSMKRADDGLPVVEQTAKGLGVRYEPNGKSNDVDLDANGIVLQNGKGMSVAPRWQDLRYYRIPMRLRNVIPKASGSDTLTCFRYGDGTFANGEFSPGLGLVVDDPQHGCIVPRDAVSLSTYRELLASSRNDWMIDET